MLRVSAWLVAFVFGCGDDPEGPPANQNLPVQPVSRTWIGGYSDSGGRGLLVLDVVQNGSDVTGKLLVGRDPEDLLFVHGTVRHDSLHLDADRDRWPYATATVEAIAGSDSLTGSLSCSSPAIDAAMACRVVPRRLARIATTHPGPRDVVAMTWDGLYVWLSANDYIRMHGDGTIADTVVVFYRPNTHWSSTALAFDGTHLWGFLPETVQLPGGNVNTSQIVEFDAAGIKQQFRVWHRTGGLAYDGTNFWSLNNERPILHAFDRSGAAVDSVEIDVPDGYHLDFGDGYFWSISWYTKLLYEIDRSGKTVAVYDLPGHGTFDLEFKIPAGITFVGSELWYGLHAFDRTDLYVLELSEIP